VDFSVRYTPALEAFRAEVRDWIEHNVPHELRFATEHGESLEQYQARRALGRKMGAKGWLYPMAPAQYGGGGLTVDEAFVLVEEFGRYELELPPYYDSGGALGHTGILVWGTDEQKATLLPPILTGEQRTWQLLTEPGAGSDLAAASTQATREGDEYIVSGAKVFVGSDHGADALWTVVRTGPAEARHNNLSWLMIAADSPGITYQPMELIGGMVKYAIFFDEVRVPADRLVGGENKGWTVASTHLELEHGMRTDHLIGTRQSRAWDALARVCRADRRLLEDEVAQDRVAEAYVRSQVVKLLGLRNYWLSIARQPMTYEGPQAYLMEKKTAQWFASALLDVLGPTALYDDGQRDHAILSDFQAFSILAMHGGGTAEIQKLIMSRRIGIGQQSAHAAGKLS
jgi:alkylation response protein AidB-like acyl-CoA dehydrogenase